MINPFKYLLPKKLRGAPAVPAVRLEGLITAKSGRLQSNLSLANCAAQLEKAFAEKSAPAVALIINSPGGSPVQSRLIYRRIRDLAAEHSKKVLVFVEDVAASGGYMIACAGDEIYADPFSVVGSIGVVSASFGFPKLLEKIGVERRVYTAGKNKVSLDPFQPAKEADIEHLKELQLQIHQVFIDMVRTSRGSRLSDDENLFTGMFWTGLKGKELGLVDELGDIRSIIKARFGAKTEIKLIEAPRNFLGQVKSAGAVRAFTGGLAAQALEEAALLAEERSARARFGL